MWDTVMSKPVKDLITKELREQYQGVDSVCVVDLTGLDSKANHAFRGGLRAKGIAMHVVKNSLARRAFREGPLAPLGEALDGPCALVTGGESIVDVAKELAKWAKQFPQVGLKKAIIEGDADLVGVAELATWKGRTELIGEIAMLAASPGRSIAGCLNSPGGKIAGCLKALIEKQEGGEEEAAAA
jgi:large subunit ribosomal protein L10